MGGAKRSARHSSSEPSQKTHVASEEPSQCHNLSHRPGIADIADRRPARQESVTDYASLATNWIDCADGDSWRRHRLEAHLGAVLCVARRVGPFDCLAGGQPARTEVHALRIERAGAGRRAY